MPPIGTAMMMKTASTEAIFSTNSPLGAATAQGGAATTMPSAIVRSNARTRRFMTVPEPPAGETESVRGSVPVRHSQPQHVEARGAARGADVDPLLLVTELNRQASATDVPAHAGARLVRELVDVPRILIGRADITPPRIPPAAGLRRALRDVRVDKAPTDAGRDVGVDVAFEKAVQQIHARRERLELAADTEFRIRWDIAG